MQVRSLTKPMERVEQEELLDLGQGSVADVVENLAEMQRINDWLGGTAAITRHLYPRLLVQNKPVTLLDLGTGGAGLPLLLVNWARRLRIPLHVLAVDWSSRNIRVARESAARLPEIQLLRADALRLPLGEKQVDFVISTLFLHHLPPEKLVAVLSESYRMARQAVIMSDLVRGWLPYLTFRWIQPVFARNFLTRSDGALSIRRAYTPEELYRMAVRAGLPDPHVYVHFPWRMTLVAGKTPGDFSRADEKQFHGKERK